MKERWHLEQYLKDTTAAMSDSELIVAVLEKLMKEAKIVIRDKERKQE